MNKELIKQIESIKGVKTVEPMDDRVVVAFEPQLTSVHVTNLEQLDFMWLKYFGEKHGKLICDDMCVSTVHKGSVESGWDHLKDAKKDSTVIDFSQYINDYNLTDEWKKYLIGEAEKRGFVNGVSFKGVAGSLMDVKIKIGENYNIQFMDDVSNIGLYCDNSWIYHNGKWGEIIPDEIDLVDGYIYFDEVYNKIFRHNYPSSKDTDFYKTWRNEIWDVEPGDSSKPISATQKQKRKLIKAEVKNGYFHE